MNDPEYPSEIALPHGSIPKRVAACARARVDSVLGPSDIVGVLLPRAVVVCDVPYNQWREGMVSRLSLTPAGMLAPCWIRSLLRPCPFRHVLGDNQ